MYSLFFHYQCVGRSGIHVWCCSGTEVPKEWSGWLAVDGFVSFHLNPLVQTLPSYVKNATHLLNKLQDFDDIPPNALLVTLYVTSSYTNIPTIEGVDACTKLLDERIDKSVPTESLRLKAHDPNYE